jgi:DNA-binding response OmpR family regulator
MVEPGSRKTDILLVDNDSRILELVAWFLAKRGFTVRTALSFRDARELIAERRPELLLSDIDLGEENAREELPRLAALGILPPTLVVSGYLDAEIVKELEALPPVIGTLAKPYDFAVLEERVRACLAQLAGGGGPELTGSPAVEQPGVELPITRADPPEAALEAEDEDGWIEIVPQDPAATRTPAQPAAPHHSESERGLGAGSVPFRLT